MTPIHTPQRRPSWRGVIAGLIMGLVVILAMFAIALILSSFLPFDLKGTSITAGIYAVITALISAFTAGYFAVKYSAPEALFGDGTDIDPSDAKLTGMLTAATIVLATTFFTISSATSIISTATSAVTGTVGAIAQTTGSVVGAGTNAIGSVVGSAAQDPQIQQQAQKIYQQVTGDISRSDVEKWVAKNTDNLNQAQINATTDVVLETVNRTKADLQQLDFTNLDTWKNIDDIAKRRLADIESDLTGQELLARLQQQGLSEAQAVQVRDEIVSSYNEYKSQTEQYIAQAKQTADQAILQAEQALQQAEDAARKAALYAGLFWLISTLLTFVASIFGAKKAAANYRLQRPIITYGDNVR